MNHLSFVERWQDIMFERYCEEIGHIGTDVTDEMEEDFEEWLGQQEHWSD